MFARFCCAVAYAFAQSVVGKTYRSMKRSRPFLIICIGTLVCSITPLVQAQEFNRFDNMRAEGTSYHIFAKQGEATIQILVLGKMGSSGIYEVGVGIELDQLLALTGGTIPAASTGSETRVTVRLFREGTGRRDLVYEAPLERMLAEPGLYPPLQDGDVLTVETFTIERDRFGWRDALSIVTSLTSIVLLIDRIAGR